MSKYQPLSDRLAGHNRDEWRASFAELEQVLGFPLPKSARTTGTWWGNEGEKAHNRAWLELGWRVADVDRAAGLVTFRRAPVAKAGASALERARFFQAKGKLGPAAMVGGMAALAAGIGALAMRALLWRKSP